MIKLETSRLFMRPFLVEDAEYMFELNSDTEVIQYTGDTAFKNKEEVADFIKKYDQYTKYQTGRFQLFLKQTGEYIGFCGLKTHRDNSVDLGFRLARKFWGQGYAYEAAVKSIEYGFKVLQLSEIKANVMPENTSSEKLILKLGFQFESSIIEDGIKWNIFKLKN